jgi:hypothetical protein
MNYSVKQLTNKIEELAKVRYPNDHSMKWAYTCGILEAILDWEVRGYGNGIRTLQENINDAYERYDKELQQELVDLSSIPA